MGEKARGFAEGRIHIDYGAPFTIVNARENHKFKFSKFVELCKCEDTQAAVPMLS